MPAANWDDEHLKQAFLDALYEEYKKDILNTKEINDFVSRHGYQRPDWLLDTRTYKAGWGKWKIHVSSTPASHALAVHDMEDHIAHGLATTTDEAQLSDLGRYVPEMDPTYKPFGFYDELKLLISCKVFYPVYITGLSGNGKTLMVIQACADADRELIRVNITKLTDELDLIGGYELINGNTQYRKGPVVMAMERGAVLLLDETDYGTENLLCLQPILEGKPLLIKKTGEVVKPMRGFQIIATANTKGRGSDDGRYVGANILNEAFLERFAITCEQEYPPEEVERSILRANFQQLNMTEDQFVGYLVKWAGAIRAIANEGTGTEVISTRRLVHICKAFAMFKNRQKAIELCLNRFGVTEKRAMLDAYSKIDPNPNAAPGFIWTPAPPPPPKAPDPKPNWNQAAAATQNKPGTIPGPTPKGGAAALPSVPNPTGTGTPQNPAGKPQQPWATVKHLMDVTRKNGQVVKVTPPDPMSGQVAVVFDGVTLIVDPKKIPTSKNATVLEEIVQFCIDIKQGKANASANPYV